jgi:hypothetical protein
MIPDFPHNISIRLARLKFFLLGPEVALSLPCWLSQFRKANVRTQQIFFSIVPILFLYYEDSLVSSNLNSNLLRIHCVRPNVNTRANSNRANFRAIQNIISMVKVALMIWSSGFFFFIPIQKDVFLYHLLPQCTFFYLFLFSGGNYSLCTLGFVYHHLFAILEVMAFLGVKNLWKVPKMAKNTRLG